MRQRDELLDRAQQRAGGRGPVERLNRRLLARRGILKQRHHPERALPARAQLAHPPKSGTYDATACALGTARSAGSGVTRDGRTPAPRVDFAKTKICAGESQKASNGRFWSTRQPSRET
jgi:hypothetical protein